MKIIDYHCITSDDPETLDIIVERWMEQEWQPFGSISVSICAMDCHIECKFAQAMVKYEDQPNPQDAS